MSLYDSAHRSLEFIKTSPLPNNKQEVKGQILGSYHTYKLTWVRPIPADEKTIKDAFDKTNPELSSEFIKNLEVIKSLSRKTLSFSIHSDGTIERVYKSSRTQQYKIKKYTPKDLEQKLDKTLQKPATDEVIRRIISFRTFLADIKENNLKSDNSNSILTVDVFKKDCQVLRKEQQDLETRLTDVSNEIDLLVDQITAMKKGLKENLSVEEASTTQPLLSETIKKVEFKAQTRNLLLQDLRRLLFNQISLLETVNGKKDTNTLEEMESEFSVVISEMKKLHKDNINLIKKLDEFFLTQKELDGSGFCAAVAQNFLLELPENPTPSQFIDLAAKLSKGLVNKRLHIEDMLLRYLRPADSLPSSFGKGVLAMFSDTIYWQENRKQVVEVNNKILQTRGIKLTQVSYQMDGQMDTTALPPGKYYVNIRSNGIKKQNQSPINHAIAFVKNKDNTSCIFDPNFGLTFCRNDQEVVEKFNMLKTVYHHCKWDSNFRISIEKIVKLP